MSIPFSDDLLILADYGGPESPDDVRSFLDRITAGRPISSARRRLVEARYASRGGVSPLPGQCRSLRSLLCRAWFPETGPGSVASRTVPVVIGNLFSPPFLADVVHDAVARGASRLLVVPTTPFESPQRSRYREILTSCVPDSVAWRMTPCFGGEELYVKMVADTLLTALANVELTRTWSESRESRSASQEDTVIFFSAHALPITRSRAWRYEEQIRNHVTAVVARTHLQYPWQLVFQSRSGSPEEAWTEPEIREALRSRKQGNRNLQNIIVVPVGFLLENMETVYDLDTDLAAAASHLGLRLIRVATPGLDPRIPDLIKHLIAPV